MKLKKLLASILAVAMVLSTMSFTAFAAETTVSIAEDFYNAVANAQSGDVINLTEDVTYEVWNSVANKSDLTINGNGKTITVNAVDSGINGGGLFLKASNLTINDLNVVLPAQPTAEMERLATMYSGNLNNVSITGGSYALSVLGGNGAVVINNCNFADIDGWAIETEAKGNTELEISDSTFDEKAVIIRGENNTFTGNTITNAGEGVNVLGDAVISGNDFGESSLGIDRGVTVTVENNTIKNVELSAWLEGDYSAVTVESNSLGVEAVKVLETVISDVKEDNDMLPSGTFDGGMVNIENPEATFITTSISNLYAKESIVLKIYDANDNLLATTTAAEQTVALGASALSVYTGILGTDDWWTTTWENDKLRADYVPAYGVLYVDGNEMNKAEIQMIKTNGEQEIIWGEVNGVNPAPVMIGSTYYSSLDDALAAAVEGDTITMYADAEIAQATAFKKAITLDLNNNTLNMTAQHGTFSPSEPRITAYYITAPVTIQNGTVNVNNDVVPTGMDHGLFFVVTPGALTFDNVELNSDGFASYAMFGTYGELEFNNSTVNVTGDTGSERVIYSEEPGSLDVVASSITATNIEKYGIEMWAPYTIDEDSTINATFYVPSNLAETVKLTFEPTAKQEVYDIYVESVDGKNINRMSAVQVKFALDNANMSYTLAPVDGVTLTNDIDNEEAYVFNFNGVDAPDASGTKIPVGTVTFGGYGAFNFTVDTAYEAKVKTAQLTDNIVEEYVPTPDAANEKQGTFDVTSSAITGAKVEEAKRDVKVVISFNNELSDVINEANYNDMTVTITGSNNEVHTAQVGDIVDGQANYTAEKAEMTFNVTAGYRYTVVVKGEGYRTARYSTVVDAADDALVLNFWNNAKDNFAFIENGVEHSRKTVTFLAGDIAQDNIIDKYDLAAVVSYFGFDNLKTANPDYVKYDLNRDGKIDADDISYVLVSWGK